MVVLVNEDDFWFVVGELGIIYVGESHDDDEVAGVDEVSGGAHDGDVAGAACVFDDVSFVAGAVGDVGDEDFFVSDDSGGVHEVLVDGDGAVVVDLSVGNFNAMDF